MRLLALTLIAGCAAPPPPPGTERDRAFAALESETGVRWTARFHDDLGTPAFLDGRTAPLIARPTEAARGALSFFKAHAALFSLGDADAELDSDGADADELGMAHARFRQVVAGVPVRGRALVAHFAADGALVRVHGRYAPLPPVEVVPIVAAGDALAIASNAVAAAHPNVGANRVVAAAPALAVEPEPAPRLVWSVDVEVDDPRTPARTIVLVDAATGAVARTVDRLDTIAATGVGVFGDVEPLDVVARRGRYYLEDQRAGSPAQKIFAAPDGALPGDEVASDRLDRWDEGGDGPGAAVDAAAFLFATHDWFARVHGRDGFADDGAGVRATVHYGDRLALAFWNGRQLGFGDGDGETVAPPAGALDVVAHEYAHAVVESSAGLGPAGEPGALGEAIADLFGCFVEQDLLADGNWQIGERLARQPLRDLADPHATGDPASAAERVAVDEDRGAIHANATIVGHAGWLVAAGGAHPLGATAASRIFYRALVRYLGPWSGFRDAADATVAAARDLFGDGAAASSVADAWRAVGVIP